MILIHPVPACRPWLLAAALLCGPGAGQAAETATAFQAMTGIHAVALQLEGIEDDYSAHGLVRPELERLLVARLAGAGLEVIPPGNWLDRQDSVLLTLRLRLNRAPYYFFLYNINLAMHSAVTLASNPGASFATIMTWSDGWVGDMQPTELAQVREFATLLVDRFLAEYHVQNGG